MPPGFWYRVYPTSPREHAAHGPLELGGVLHFIDSSLDCTLQILLYEAVMAAGVTMLSIGHRPVLRRYHSVALHFEGSQVRALTEQRSTLTVANHPAARKLS